MSQPGCQDTGLCWKLPHRCFQSLRWGGFEFGEQPPAVGSLVLGLGHGFAGHLFQEKQNKTKTKPCHTSVEFLGTIWGPKEDVVIVTRGIFSCDPRGSVQDVRLRQPLWEATWGPSQAAHACVCVCVSVSVCLFFFHTSTYSFIHTSQKNGMCFFGFGPVLRRLAS